MRIPSAYEPQYARASRLNPDLASEYIRHTMLDDPLADAAVAELSSFGVAEANRFIRAGMDRDHRTLGTAPHALRDFFAELAVVREMRHWYEIDLSGFETGHENGGVGFVPVSDVEWTVECDPPELDAYRPGVVFRDCEVAPRMVVVPRGAFTMGSPESESQRRENEGPQHTVTLAAPLAVGVFEVTHKQMDACVRMRVCGEYLPADGGFGRGSSPANNVSWHAARRYLAWLSELTGKRYRLLTEAEWEYVARAGSDAQWWGLQPTEVCKHVNGLDTSVRLALQLGEGAFPCPETYFRTSPVGSFEPNAFGLYDVLGNVSEWVHDCYHADLGRVPADGGAYAVEGCARRVVRGGSWLHGTPSLWLSSRLGMVPEAEFTTSGFRVARELGR